jgi:hypothetical protein
LILPKDELKDVFNMAIDYSDSANALIKDVLKAHHDRNDLAVEISNGSTVEWKVDYYVEHGSTASFKGSPVLHAVNPTVATHVVPTTHEIGLEAGGAGCNITVILSSKDKKERFMVILATPSNKTNYSKVHHQTTKEHSTEAYYKKADETEKHYANEGSVSNTKEGIRIHVNMTGASPSCAFVHIYNH